MQTCINALLVSYACVRFLSLPREAEGPGWGALGRVLAPQGSSSKERAVALPALHQAVGTVARDTFRPVTGPTKGLRQRDAMLPHPQGTREHLGVHARPRWPCSGIMGPGGDLGKGVSDKQPF